MYKWLLERLHLANSRQRLEPLHLLATGLQPLPRAKAIRLAHRRRTGNLPSKARNPSNHSSLTNSPCRCLTTCPKELISLAVQCRCVGLAATHPSLLAGRSKYQLDRKELPMVAKCTRCNLEACHRTCTCEALAELLFTLDLQVPCLTHRVRMVTA